MQIPSDAGVVTAALPTDLILPTDDIAEVTVDAITGVVQDGDIICITESVVARSQNRYLSCDQLAEDIADKLNITPGGTIAVISPILSRNRFALILKAIAGATGGGRVIVQLSVPDDEVGNEVIDRDFASTRLRLKNIFNSLQEARGNTPHLNVLIREILVAFKLQELGYNLQGIRKITGQGTADLTIEDEDGRTICVEVSFENPGATVQKVLGIMRDTGADGALAVTVDLQRQSLTVYDATTFEKERNSIIAETSYADEMPLYRDADCIYAPEVHNRHFAHPITGEDYSRMYQEIVENEGADCEILLTNNPLRVFQQGFIDGIIVSAVHAANELTELFLSFGTKTPVTTIGNIGPEPWGVIGSNVSDREKGILKLLPANADGVADGIKEAIKSNIGKDVEVLIFGDGAYKDPDTGIYELADPHPAIGSSGGLRKGSMRTGTKLKLQVETLFRQGHSREEISEIVQQKNEDVTHEQLGTTPRSVTSLLGTIADLAAGSADAGTPIVLVRNFQF